MTEQDAKKLKDTIAHAYGTRKDYPPFALMAWDDRTRYQEWIFKLIDEEVAPIATAATETEMTTMRAVLCRLHDDSCASVHGKKSLSVKPLGQCDCRVAVACRRELLEVPHA